MGKLIGYLRAWVQERNTMSEWSKEQWRAEMINNVERINLKRKKKIPDQPRYVDKVAGASIKSFKDVINPSFISKHGLNRDAINAKHARHIAQGFQKWDKHLDDAYQTVDGVPGKVFTDKVNGAVEHYAKNAEIGLRLTGDKVRGYGAVVKAMLWLIGDDFASANLDPADNADGIAASILANEFLKGSFKAALEPLLVKAGSEIIRSGFQTDVIAAMNRQVNDLVAGLQDRTKYALFTPGGESHCDFGMDLNIFYLEVKVSEA